MSDLFKLVTGQKATAIVGMTKNVGKTVTLNHLVSAAERQDFSMGLLSAGYDGERFDRLTLKDKPRIYAPQKALVATAEACFKAADANLTLIETTDVFTPLGPVCLGRVKEAGLVELAGPGSVSGIKYLIERLLALGAAHVLVDGAINRLAAASPLVTDAVILASGASLGPTMDDVIKKTVYRYQLFTTPALKSEEMLRAAKKGLETGHAAKLCLENNTYQAKSVTGLIPLLAGAQLAEICREETKALVFGGALVDHVLQAIMEKVKKLPLVVVHDATRFFISPEIYQRFIARGGSFAVLEPIKLLALTLNPTNPSGRGYNPQQFLEKMQEVLYPCPVYDLVYQEGQKI